MNKPLGNLVNLYIILIFVAIVAITRATIFGSFWLFIIILIAIPILLGVIRSIGLFTFVIHPVSSSKQIGREVVAPIFKSKLILILIAIVAAYFFIVRWYIQ